MYISLSPALEEKERVCFFFFFYLDLLMGYHACYLQHSLRRDNKRVQSCFITDV